MRKNRNSAREENVLEITAEMQGQMTFKDPVSLRINGQFEGQLQTRGTLEIGSQATVEAHIEGEHIVIAGRVRGQIVASQSLQLLDGCVLDGDICTPSLSVESGAVFEGRCQMRSQDRQEQSAETHKGYRTEAGEKMNLEQLATYLNLQTDQIQSWVRQKEIPFTQGETGPMFERSKIDTWAIEKQMSLK